MEKIHPDSINAGLDWVCSSENNHGMVGQFRGLTINGEHWTVFKPDIDTPPQKICRHENISQAELMAIDYNEYSMLM